MSDPRIVGWDDVAGAARSVGHEDFAKLVEEADPEQLERAWQGALRSPPKHVRSLAKQDSWHRFAFVRAVLRRWGAGSVGFPFTAGAVRLALSSAPRVQREGCRQFEIGNQAALTTGVYSPRALAPHKADALAEVVDIFIADHKLGDEAEISPGDRLRLQRYATTWLRIKLAEDFVLEHGDYDVTGALWPVGGLLTQLRHLESREWSGLALGTDARTKLQAARAAGARDALRAQRELREQYGGRGG